MNSVKNVQEEIMKIRLIIILFMFWRGGEAQISNTTVDWVFMGTLSVTGGGGSGSGTSLSADGMTVAVGAYFMKNCLGGGTTYGGARVYKRCSKDNGTSFSWHQLGQDLFGETGGDQFGNSVKLSSDGYTMAVGAPQKGMAKVFRFDPSTGRWEKLGQTLQV